MTSKFTKEKSEIKNYIQEFVQNEENYKIDLIVTHPKTKKTFRYPDIGLNPTHKRLTNALYSAYMFFNFKK